MKTVYEVVNLYGSDGKPIQFDTETDAKKALIEMLAQSTPDSIAINRILRFAIRNPLNGVYSLTIDE